MSNKLLVGVGILALGIQILPYGRSHVNPPVRQEPQWDRQETRQLAKRACFDCHSNETNWPWYASIAPFSWFTHNHVNEGRRKLNFSEWDRTQKEAKDAAKTIQKGEMPLRSYLLAHPEARLEPSEKEALTAGLRTTLRNWSNAKAATPHVEEEQE